MKVQFLGAAQTVTGSCYMIEACGKRFCVKRGGTEMILAVFVSRQQLPAECLIESLLIDFLDSLYDLK